ncbi:MAG: ribokinase [Angelakisella sp.]|nr:ribokinase [Angelakisella sp.]
MFKKPRILVVGSLVMDLIVSTEHFPSSGETVLGKSFTTAPGGKGANQAVQAARLGAEVTMVGAVGNDAFGQELMGSLKASGVNVDHVSIKSETSSAIGNILLEVKEGQKSKNRIIVVPGANYALNSADVQFLSEEIDKYDMVILQLEITEEVNEIVAEYAYKKQVPVMLNSAPYVPISQKLLSYINYISPNEHEAAGITGITIRSEDEAYRLEDVKSVTKKLMELGIKNAIITLGSNGAAIANEQELIYAPCVDIVEVKDPTAAGDSFVGAFCTGVCAGMTHAQALEFASYTATLTVSRMGAQPSLPTIHEVVELMDQNGFSNFDKSILTVLTN